MNSWSEGWFYINDQYEGWFYTKFMNDQWGKCFFFIAFFFGGGHENLIGNSLEIAFLSDQKPACESILFLDTKVTHPLGRRDYS